MIGALAMTVLIFVSTDCPVSNRYAPEIKRLHDEFTAKGVRFRLVYPNPLDDEAAIGKHLLAFGYPPIAERDRDHPLVKMAGATITPEAAVFDARQRLVYRGRIDDRFVELGRERPAATQHDLRNALTALLAGKAVSPATTQAVGCFIADMRRRWAAIDLTIPNPGPSCRQWGHVRYSACARTRTLQPLQHAVLGHRLWAIRPVVRGNSSTAPARDLERRAKKRPASHMARPKLAQIPSTRISAARTPANDHRAKITGSALALMRVSPCCKHEARHGVA